MAGYENVIVGGGLSGGMVAQEYREAAGQGSVLIVAGEPHPPYHRPPLTKEYLRREKGLDDVYMHPAEWWAGQNVDLRLNTEVTDIDAAGHSIGITGGERIEFERLVLATGSTPRPLAGAQTIRRIEDSDALADVLQRGEGHVVVLGGGFIGVEAAASARMKGLEVTLVMQNQVVWDHLFGEQVGQYFHRHLEEHGVRILSGRDGLPEGLAERADVVVAGIGVTPNIDLASAAGLDTDTGVLVDEHLRAARRDLGGRGHRRVPERDPRPADPHRALGRRAQPGQVRRCSLGRQGRQALRRGALLLLRPGRLDVDGVRRARRGRGRDPRLDGRGRLRRLLDGRQRAADSGAGRQPVGRGGAGQGADPGGREEALTGDGQTAEMAGCTDARCVARSSTVTIGSSNRRQNACSSKPRAIVPSGFTTSHSTPPG